MNATEVLRRPVFTESGYKPYAELTLADVQARAAELAEVGRTAPLARVAPVARAWGELGRAMVAAGVGTVGGLDPELALDLARRAWVAPTSLL